MFGYELTGWFLFWLILGSVVGLLIELVLFKAACALADVNDPSWLVSFVVVVPFVVGRGFVNWGMVVLIGPRLEGLALPIVTFVLSGLIFWLVCAAIYAAVLSVSLKKGFYTAGAQAVLDALIGSLAIGITLFVLSVMQIKQGSPNKSSQVSTDPAPAVALRHVEP